MPSGPLVTVLPAVLGVLLAPISIPPLVRLTPLANVLARC